ncbi:mitochondrial RNA polymerase isoform X2 [Brevipalpus obovatus]|uniref:mitochondrial RNA polymerase isoform X2 n=1 Tax=Brevipalpus obovatus TaxID=246614 RepID=UPI003D9EBDBB
MLRNLLKNVTLLRVKNVSVIRYFASKTSVSRTADNPQDDLMDPPEYRGIPMPEDYFKYDSTGSGRDEDLDMIDKDITAIETENHLISDLKAMATNVSPAKENNRKKLDRRFVVSHFRSSLKSYLMACINADMMDRAQQSFLYYRTKNAFRDPVANPVDTSVYNLMFKGWVKRKNSKKVFDVFSLMKRSRVKCDIDSYSAMILAAIDKDPVDLVVLSGILTMMERQSLKLEELLIKSKLSIPEMDKIIEKFSYLMPELEFEISPPPVPYPCKLLSNHQDAPRTEYEILPEEYHSYLSQWSKEQIDHETRGVIAIESVYQENVNFPRHGKDLWEKCVKEWRESVTNAFIKNVQNLQNNVKDDPRMTILPFLTILEVNDYVDIIMDSLISFARFYKTYSPPLSYLRRAIGRSFGDRYHGYLKNKAYPQWSHYYSEFIKWNCSPSLIAQHKPRDYWNYSIKLSGGQFSMDFDDFHLTPMQNHDIGKFLLNILLNEIKIDPSLLLPRSERSPNPTLVPVFYSVFGNSQQSPEEIRAHLTFRQLFKKFGSSEIPFETSLVPMKSPPSPWTSIDNGGYLLCKTDFLRPISFDEDEWINLEVAKMENLTPIYDALNALSMVAWKINREVLDIALTVFRSGGDKSIDIPLHDSMIPHHPNNLDKFKAYQLKKKAKQDRQNEYSLWCDCLYKLSIANHFRDRLFWLPHNIDFRGRVYACPPHLNHLGNDLSRSLMLFAKGKPLGPDGLDWLKIHLINLTGLKKRESIPARLSYCNEIMDDIIDSAEKPLDGQKWWAKQEDPWQVLACCKEIVKASMQPDPSTFVSYFPVHQDGSCNGLQHYAALGRDLQGAKSVNLYPCDKPNDVYSDVAELVEKQRQSDARSGNEIAKLLEGSIKRKVVKQTVMTYVYGVTTFGAKHQIYKQLKEMSSLPDDKLWPSSLYLTKKTFKSIATMFSATQAIQFWFTKSAILISQTLGFPVEWRTPLGLPVIQPYFNARFSNGAEVEQIVRNFKPKTIKQRNAFPPNFIHSLDSSHMMLTALESERLGLNFVAIHDSYWTHPITINEMNKICREKFVDLHSEEILQDLSNFMVERYGPLIDSIIKDPDMAKKELELLQAVPKKGTFELKNVLDSVYFFS